MLILPQQVEVSWNIKNKTHYVEKGYLFTQYRESFYVNIEDLPKTTKTWVQIKCDYCKEIIFLRRYQDHIKLRKKNPKSKDSCANCLSLKVSDNFRLKRVKWKEITQLFKKNNFILHTKKEEYKDARTKLTFICSIHPELGKQETTYQRMAMVKQRNRKNGSQCLMCRKHKTGQHIKTNYEKFYKNREVPHKLNIETAKIRFAEKGGLLLEGQKYKGNNRPLKFTCEIHPEIGIQERTLNDITNKKTKKACRQCGIEQRSGENCHLWKGGITTENMQVRGSIEYKEWTKAVFEKDQYICQACGDSAGKNLTAHHILNFSKYPELRLELDNGITLCQSCHSPYFIGSFHNLYGTQNNTKEQLEEYINIKRKEKNISEETLNEIREKNARRRIKNPNKRPYTTKLTENQVIEIIERIKKGEKDSEIAKDYPVGKGQINKIRNKKLFKDIIEKLL